MLGHNHVTCMSVGTSKVASSVQGSATEADDEEHQYRL